MKGKCAKRLFILTALHLACILAIHLDCIANADDGSQSIERFIDDGAWVIMCTDFTRWTELESEEVLSDLLRIKYPWDEEKRNRLSQNFKALAPRVARMGIEKNWIVISPQDILFRRGFPLFFSVKEGGNHSEVLELAKSMAVLSNFVGYEHLSFSFPYKDAEWFEEERLVLSGSSDVLEYYSNLEPEARPDLLEPLNELMSNGAVIAFVISPDRHARRAVKELWPRDVPAILDNIDGKMIADDIGWIGFELRANPRPVGRLIIELKSELQAKQLHTWINQKLTWLAKQRKSTIASEGLAPVRLANALRPRLSNKRIVIELDSTGIQINALYALINPAIDAARGAAAASKRQNDFKEIALALLDYEEKHKRFPPAYSVDSNGKPLLSWRVHILPFLGETELYEEFHLDEPWDSKNNRPLIGLMPAVYAETLDSEAEFFESGETTVVAPIAPSTLFANPEGTEYRRVKDKTWETLMIAEVAPEEAVVWTSPQDWKINFESALADVKREDREFFITAFCDGSTKKLSTKMATNQFKAILTIDGGERVD